MKMMKLWMLVVVATIASACSKQDVAGFEGAATKTVQFIATDAAGRTIFGEPEEGVYPVLWQEDDMISVSLNMCDRKPVSALNPTSDGTSATFTASYPEDEATNAAEKTFYAVVPNTGISQFYNKGKDDPRFIIKVLADQTPRANSCDPKVQILYAQSATYSTIPEQVEMSFKHWCAYGCMTIKNLNTTEKIAKVQLTVDSYLAGSTYWRPTAENEVDRLYNIGGSPAPKNPEKTITLNTSSVENPLWFATLPVDLSGKEMTIKLTTENGDTYTKTITFANGDGNFQAGRIAKFSVSFADVAKDVVVEPFELLEVYKENGVAQGVVFWVSEDGQTAKIVSLDRCEATAWSSDTTTPTKVTAKPEVQQIEDCAANMSSVVNWLKDHTDVTMNIVSFCQAKGDGWYWPAYYDLCQLAAAYNGVATHNDIKNKYASSPVAPSTEEAAAQKAFEDKLKEADPEATPLNTNTSVSTGTKGTGDRYWACREDAVDANNQSKKAFYVQYGYHTATSAAKTNKFFGRAVKVVTK